MVTQIKLMSRGVRCGSLTPDLSFSTEARCLGEISVRLEHLAISYLSKKAAGRQVRLPREGQHKSGKDAECGFGTAGANGYNTDLS